MSGINYDLRKIKAFAFDVDGVLSPSTIPVSPTGDPMRMANIKDGYALQLAVKKGLKIAVITGGSSLAVVNRMHLLGINDIWENASDKLPVLEDWMALHNLKEKEVAYMGDDIPDLRCLRKVGLPCCPFDAAWEVQQESIFISSHTGGYGAVRDLLEQILRAQHHWSTASLNNIVW